MLVHHPASSGDQRDGGGAQTVAVRFFFPTAHIVAPPKVLCVVSVNSERSDFMHRSLYYCVVDTIEVHTSY